MKMKKMIKIVVILIAAGVLIGGGVALYLFNMPHRNVQSAKSDYTLTGSEIVAEYLADKDAANQKYLASDGDSKILEISGVVSKISDDFDGNKVVFLKGTTVEVQSKFNVTLGDYSISFVKGKPSTNIAKSVEVTVHAEYTLE